MGLDFPQLQNVQICTQPLPPNTPLKKELHSVLQEIGFELQHDNNNQQNQQQKISNYYVKLFYNKNSRILCGISFEIEKYKVVYDINRLSQNSQNALRDWASSLPDVVRKGLASPLSTEPQEQLQSEVEIKHDQNDYEEVKNLYYLSKESEVKSQDNTIVEGDHMTNNTRLDTQLTKEGAPKGVLLSTHIQPQKIQGKLTIPLQVLRLHSSDFEFYELKANEQLLYVVVDAAAYPDERKWCSTQLAKINKFTNSQFFFSKEHKKWFSRKSSTATTTTGKGLTNIFVVGDIHLPFWDN